MSQEMLGDAMIILLYMTGYLMLLCIGGLIADYVLPHIPPLQRWLDSLPPYEDDYEDMGDHT